MKFGYNMIKSTGGSAIYIYSVQSNIILTNSSIEVLDDIYQLFYLLNSFEGLITFINFNSSLNIYYEPSAWYKIVNSRFSYENSGKINIFLPSYLKSF